MNWNPEQHYQSHTVAADYDKVRFSSLAGRVFNHLEKRTIAKCFASIPNGAQLVDIPCGTGRLAEALLMHGYQVRGMDISDEMLAVARQRLSRFGGRFTTEVADAKHPPNGHAVYEGALCARVLMHFPLGQQIAFLAGVVQLSRSLVVINQSLNSPYQRFRRRVKHWLGHRESAAYPVTNPEIKRLLADAGLREVRRYRQLRLVSEAVYIVAERVTAASAQSR
ncbi:MAG: class I SAM-dependent methyltransferase [Rhodanobacteraceae bacterium]|nr:MAG: class I SAM-dependent methyltransferase [Rhodanobacteraceae bacterium]